MAVAWLLLHGAAVVPVLLLHGVAPPRHDDSVGPPPPRCSTSMVAVSDLVLAGLDLGSGIFYY
jgi:hypothetical protein